MITRRPCMRTACGALALAMAATIATSTAFAQSGAPTADRIWAQCVLHSDTVNALINDMTNSPQGNRLGTAKEVAFVVIYSFQDNDGQPLGAGGFTGPVLCRNTTVVPNVATTLQTASIGTSSRPVDVLDVENAFILRYQESGTTNIEKRFCHTVDANSDCFRLHR
jgi:hypothetical protein